MNNLQWFIYSKFNNYAPKWMKSYSLNFAFKFVSFYQKFYHSFLHGDKDLPSGLNIEINSFCNRSCYYCPRPSNNQHALETETFYSIINQLSDWGFKGRISPHSYNEPLTDSRIFDFLSYVKRKLPFSKIVLYTNGDLLTDEKVEKFLAIGVNNIRISIHEPSSIKIENKLLALNKKYKAISLADRRDQHRFLPLSNMGGLVELGNVQKYTVCYKTNVMVIRSDGNVVLCCQDAHKKHIFGNVKEKKIETIWNEPNYKKLRMNIRTGKYDLPICQKCGREY